MIFVGISVAVLLLIGFSLLSIASDNDDDVDNSY